MTVWAYLKYALGVVIFLYAYLTLEPYLKKTYEHAQSAF